MNNHQLNAQNDIINSTLDDENVNKQENNITIIEIIKDMTIILKNLKTSVKCHSQTSSLLNAQIEKLYQKDQNQLNAKINQPDPIEIVSETSTIKTVKPEKPAAATAAAVAVAIKPRKKILPTIKPPNIINRLMVFKKSVEQAKKEKKTFTINGQYPTIRRAFIKRGWIEKFRPNYIGNPDDGIVALKQMQITELIEILKLEPDKSYLIERVIKSKLLKDYQVDFYWALNRYDAYNTCADQKKLTCLNYLNPTPLDFTSKKGLCQLVHDIYWLRLADTVEINHPRCYILDNDVNFKRFLKDYNLTAAISLLKWIVDTDNTRKSLIISTNGKIPIKYFNFALIECYKFIKKQIHHDIDEPITDASDNEWKQFIEQINPIIFKGFHFKPDDDDNDDDCSEDQLKRYAKEMTTKSDYILKKLFIYMPYINLDGYMNIWILKPINSSRGQGIHICRTPKDVEVILKQCPNRKYIIQKYIENPLLIYNTKFDIRQWFLVCNFNQLTIWMYRRCYLRFSKQTFNLRNLHESIHLTNNSVQSKYQHLACSKDPLIPIYGMWNSDQFKNYLKDIGFPTVFDDTIYPEMKQCIINIIMAFISRTEFNRKNSFELFGADFILGDNFKPWLLEINSNPALHASTPVTAKLCPQILEDVLKVVIDYKKNTNANTGDFEQIYKVTSTNNIINTNPKLEITITPLSRNNFFDHDTFNDVNRIIKSSNHSNALTVTDQTLLQIGLYVKNIMKKLLTILKEQRKNSQKITVIESP